VMLGSRNDSKFLVIEFDVRSQLEAS